MRALKENEVYAVWEHNGSQSDSLLGLFKSFQSAHAKLNEFAKAMAFKPDSIQGLESEVRYEYGTWDYLSIEIEKIEP